MEKILRKPEKGNGKAVFLSDGTPDEYAEYIEDEERGWKGFKNKIFNLK